MNVNYNKEQGFTLVEMLMSIVASGVLMLTIMSVMGLSSRKWAEANDVRELTTELSISLNAISDEVKGARRDSVTVSAGKDTLKVGGGVRFFRDGSNNLVIRRNGNDFELLEGMATQFVVDKPVVRAPGDTLDMVSVMLVVHQDDAHDSTSIWLTPRL